MATKNFFKPEKNAYCDKCKGKCWNPDDNSATQRNARKQFGVTPNNCVNAGNGKTHCPYA